MLKHLGCPYCGTRISAELGEVWKGWGPYESKHTVVKGFYCRNAQCDAEWDDKSNGTKAPRVTYEEL